MEVSWIIFWFIVGLFLIATTVVLVIVLQNFKWRTKWVLLEEQPNGKCLLNRSGRARLIGVGSGGEELYLLKGINKIKPYYGKRIGKNQIAWAIGQDGYWYNVDFGGLDKKLRELGVFPIHMDMRYAYASIRQLNDKRHNDKTFMEKWGTTIAFGMLFLCIVAMVVFASYTYKGVANVQGAVGENLKIQKEVTQSTKELIERLNVLNNANQPSGARTLTPA